MSSEDEDVRIGARLRELRDLHELTQDHFAKSLGVSLRAYQTYERGETPISRKLITGLASVYSADFAWLFGGDEYESIQQQKIKEQNPPGIGRLLQWGEPSYISAGGENPHIRIDAGEQEIDVFLEGLQYIVNENAQPDQEIINQLNSIRKYFSEGISDVWKPRFEIEVFLSDSGIHLISTDREYLQDAFENGELEDPKKPQVDQNGPYYYRQIKG